MDGGTWHFTTTASNLTTADGKPVLWVHETPGSWLPSLPGAAHGRSGERLQLQGMESPLQRRPLLPAGAPRAGDNGVMAKPSLSKGQAANLEPCEFTSEVSLCVAGSPPAQADTEEPLLGGGKRQEGPRRAKSSGEKGRSSPGRAHGTGRLRGTAPDLPPALGTQRLLPHRLFSLHTKLLSEGRECTPLSPGLSDQLLHSFIFSY